MIPVKLTLQGLYSYQEKQTIDFTKLTSANLFGIFGAVGSGKSSVLEAITFAIYGKTDRLNLSGDNRNYNMMNLKSDELLIDFVFETGKNQTSYRAVVKGRRNNKRFEDVKALDRSAYQLYNEEWLPIETEALEKAIGLSYDNFKRTIIIPQGQFQEFLQLGNKDRTQMMKELFNLGKYEMYYKVVSLESKNTGQRQKLEGQLQQLGNVDPEQVNQYQLQLEQLKKELEELLEKQTSLQQKDTQLKQLKELVKKVAEAQLSFQQLKEKEPQFNELEAKTEKFERCIIQFKSLMDALDVSNSKIKQKNKQVELETEKLKQIEKETEQSEKLFIEIKKDYEERESLKKQADELKKVLRIIELLQKVEKEEDRIKKGNEVLTQTVGTIEEQITEKEHLEVLIIEEKAKLPDLSILSKVKAWHVENRNLSHQVADQNAQIEKSIKEIGTIEARVQSCFQGLVFTGFPVDHNIPAAINFLKEKTEQQKKKITAIEAEADHYRVLSKLDAYAKELQDGEACPLCGSPHHPAIFSAASVSEALINTANAKSTLEKEIMLIGETISQLNEANIRLTMTDESLSEFRQRHEALTLKTAEHTALFLWEEFKEESAVTNAFESAELIQKSLAKHEKDLEKLRSDLDKLLKYKEYCLAEIEKIKTSLTIGQTEIKTLSEQLSLIDFEHLRTKPSVEIELKCNTLLEKYERVYQLYSELTTKLTDFRKNKDILSGSVEANQNELKAEQEYNTSLSTQLKDRIEENGYAQLTDVEQVLNQQINLEQEKKRLSIFRQQLALTQNKAGQLQEELGDQSYDTEKHLKISEELESVQNMLNQRNQEIGKIAELLQKLKIDLENQAVLRKHLEDIELRAENIRTLKSLFKGSGFVNWVSSVYLQNLCHAANDRFFQLTRQKLSLELTDDNNFQVRDFMNGGKVRSTKTLSGGQTFQAALSLALALADNIQKITESNQNFFFLDEGFGSLDKEALSDVFETLKALRRENRIVGVISHVEEMQQEIEVHLKIENLEERGSVIRQSWRYSN